MLLLVGDVISVGGTRRIEVELAHASKRVARAAKFWSVALVLSVCALLGVSAMHAEPARAVGSWQAIRDMSTARTSATATTLLDGRVLIAAGDDAASQHLRSAEIYDPIRGAWSRTGSLNVARTFHTATLLNDGRVLVLLSLIHI